MATFFDNLVVTALGGDSVVNQVEAGAPGFSIEGTGEYQGSAPGAVGDNISVTLTFTGGLTQVVNATITSLDNTGSPKTFSWSITETNLSATFPGLAEGNDSVKATFPDGTDSNTFSFLYDKTPPAAPAISSIGGGDSTVSGQPGDNTVVGTAEAGTTVAIKFGSGTLATVVADGTGHWTYSLTPADVSTIGQGGGKSITAAASDAAGNNSPESVPFIFSVDTLAPAAPVVVSITNDTGASGSDGLTSDTSLTIHGTADANVAVEVFRDGTSIGTTTADAAGNWSLADGATLVDGTSYGYTAKTNDAAGNTSAASATFIATIDTTAPAVPVVASIENDTGANSSDGLTSDTSLTIHGTAEANIAVQVFRDGTSIGTTTADGSGNWSLADSATLLTGTSYAYTARATDAAGNVSGASSVFTATIDTSAPFAPTVTSIENDTGASSTDGLTSDTTLTVHGTAEALSALQVFRDGTLIGTTTADGAGNWSLADGATLVSGTSYGYTAKVTDAAGNASPTSSAFVATIDTSAPVAPAVTGIASDTGSSGSDGVTSDTSLTVNGTAEANSSVEVFRDGTSIGTTTANGAGNWSLADGATLVNGSSYAYTAKAMDAAGNVSGASSAFTATIDTSAPAVPVVASIENDTGASSSDGVTSDTSLTVHGTAAANSAVEVFRDGTSIGTTTADGSGNWSLADGATLVNGTSYHYTAKASDTAGNSSSESSAFTATIDTSAPVAPVVSSIENDTGASSTDGLTSDTTLTIHGTAAALSTVEVFRDGTSLGTTGADALGNWSLADGATLVNGTSYGYTAKATDAAGNTSPTSSAFIATIDTSSPAAPIVVSIANDTGSSSTDGLTSDTSLTINGTAAANIAVQVFRDGTSIGTTTADGAGNWSLADGATLVDGTSYAYTAKATDTAGNTSAASSAFTATIDTSAPILVVDLPASSNEDQPAAVTFAFNNAPIGFTQSDVTASNGTISGFAQDDATHFHATFTPTPNFSGLASVTVAAGSFTDLAGNSSTLSSDSMNVVGVNDVPTGSGAGGAIVYLENQAPTAIDATLTVSDIDNINFVGALVAISGDYHAGQDVLGFTNQNGIVGNFNAATGALTLSGASSVANYQSALRSVTYSNGSDDPAGGARTVDFQVNDGSGLLGIGSAGVTVVPVNDAPAITSNGGDIGAAVSIAENTTAVTTVVASDPDSPVLAYSIAGGADAAKFQINAVTGALSFVTAPNFEAFGDADHNNTYVVQVQASDGSLSDSQTISVAVTDVNEPFVTPNWLGSVGTGPHPAGWLPVGIFDFNNDGDSDIAWLNTATNAVEIWKMKDGQWAGTVGIGSHSAGWQPVAFDDFTNDGIRDVAWFNPTTGGLDIWKLLDGQFAAAVQIGTNPGSNLGGIGDFNNDGNPDVLWFNPTTNNVQIWKTQNGQHVDTIDVGPHPAGWQPKEIADLDGDGAKDIAWYNAAQNRIDIWKMVDGHWTGSLDLGPHPAGWQPLGTGDLNGDGTEDFVWYNPTTNNIDVWIVSGGHWAGSIDLGSHPAGSVAVGLGDVDHNGATDIIWRNTTDGSLDTWLMGSS